MRNFEYLSLILFSLLLITCKNEKDNIRKRHYPLEDITQKIENEKALELYDKGGDQSGRGDYKSAKISFNKSLEIEKNPLTYNELGWIEFAEKKYQKAIEYYSQGRTLDSLYWPLYINEARSYWKLNEYDNAEKILFKLKDLCASNYWIAYADFYLTIVYFNSGQECGKVFEYLKKSEPIYSDPNLRDHYLKFKDQIEKKCG